MGTRQGGAPPAGGPCAVRARLHAPAYTEELTSEWRCHKTINVGLPEEIHGSSYISADVAKKGGYPRASTPRQGWHGGSENQGYNA